MPLGSSDIDLYESEDPIWNPALLTIPIPGIRKMVNLASTMNDVIHLSIGQPDLPAPDTVVEASVEALRAGQTGSISRLPPWRRRDGTLLCRTRRSCCMRR